MKMFLLFVLLFTSIAFPVQSAHADRGSQCVFWVQNGDPTHYAARGLGRHWQRYQRDCIVNEYATWDEPAAILRYQNCPDNIFHGNERFVITHCQWYSGPAARTFKGALVPQ